MKKLLLILIFVFSLSTADAEVYRTDRRIALSVDDYAAFIEEFLGYEGFRSTSEIYPACHEMIAKQYKRFNRFDVLLPATDYVALINLCVDINNAR